MKLVVFDLDGTLIDSQHDSHTRIACAQAASHPQARIEKR
ncbi:HAD family hydrolase [Paracoccus sp. S3-43]|nr:HAD family hydrolase [Paracoccus sp. S3-43]WEF25110.1 HAD family hydrolase [Paracoccus sp. S3-43]